MPTARKRLANVTIATLSTFIAGGLGMVIVDTNRAEAQTVQVAKTYAPPVSYTTPPEPTKVAFIGDSYTVGSGASNPTKRWTTLLSRDMGWLELNYGIGGTNYTTAGNITGGKAYEDHLTDLIISRPDIVFVSSAGNTLNVDQTPGIAATFQTLREAMPDVKIYATSPYTRHGWYSERIAEFGKDVEAGVEAVGGEYLDLQNPLGAHPDAIAKDDVHPNNTGHQVIAEAVHEALL